MEAIVEVYRERTIGVEGIDFGEQTLKALVPKEVDCVVERRAHQKNVVDLLGCDEF